MAVLEPRLAILDEIDSGLDIDALRVVARGVNALRRAGPARCCSSPTTSGCSNYVCPDRVHVMAGGRIVRSGGPELADELEQTGYAWVGRQPRAERASAAVDGRCRDAAPTRASRPGTCRAPREPRRGSPTRARRALARFARARLPHHAPRGLALHEPRAARAAVRSSRAAPSRVHGAPRALAARRPPAGAAARLRQRPLRAGALDARRRSPRARCSRASPRRSARARAVAPHLGRLARPDGHAFAAAQRGALARTARSCSCRAARGSRGPSSSSSCRPARGGPSARPPAHARRRGRGRARDDRRDSTSAGRAATSSTRSPSSSPRDGAASTHYKLQRESGAARSTCRRAAEQGRGSRARRALDRARRAARAQRAPTRARRRGRASATLNGLYMADGTQLVDTPHRGSTTRSRTAPASELYKGVLDGRARGVFDGRILSARTRRRPTRTRRTRTCCSPTTRSSTRSPQLEIFADDVKCGHGGDGRAARRGGALLPALARHRREARRAAC